MMVINHCLITWVKINDMVKWEGVTIKLSKIYPIYLAWIKSLMKKFKKLPSPNWLSLKN